MVKLKSFFLYLVLFIGSIVCFFLLLHFSSADQTSGKIIKLAHRQLEIPLEFIDKPRFNFNRGKGINLVYMLPDFSSRQDLKEDSAQEIDNRNDGFMLLEDASSRPSLNVIYENIRKSVAREKNIGRKYGLEKKEWYRQREGNEVLYYTTYINRDKNGDISDYIECSTVERVPYPGCSYYFNDKGLRYDSHFDMKYLPAWKNHKASAVKFVDSFEIISSF